MLSMPSYLYALRLVRALLEDPLAAAARVAVGWGPSVPLRRNAWQNCFLRLTEVSWPIWQEGLSEALSDDCGRRSQGLVGVIRPLTTRFPATSMQTFLPAS